MLVFFCLVWQVRMVRAHSLRTMVRLFVWTCVQVQSSRGRTQNICVPSLARVVFAGRAKTHSTNRFF